MDSFCHNSPSKFSSKDSRWDRIRKKHMNNVNVTTATVKKFLNMDFVNENQLTQMIATDKNVCQVIDPNKVMDIRHEAIKKKAKNRMNQAKVTRIRVTEPSPHNEALESRLIGKELEKFRREIETTRRVKSERNARNRLEINFPTNLIDNEALCQTIEDSENITNSFYSKIIEATDQLEQTGQVVQFSEASTLEATTPEDTSAMEELTVIELNDDFLKVTRYEQYFLSESAEQLAETAPNVVQILESQNDHEFQETITQIQTMSSMNADTMFQVKQIDIERKDFSQLVIRNYCRGQEFSGAPVELSDNERKFVAQYFHKWKNFTTIAGITKNSVNNTDKVNKINQFLNKIRLNQPTKATGAIEAATKNLSKELKKNYEHKLKIQQDIIELQKLKLERQERIITDMKISKLADTSKISKTEIKNELYQAIKHGNVKLRCKAKAIQISANIKDDREEEDEEKRRMLAQGLIVPQFLAKMQARSLERATKHEEARERRLRLEREREEAKQAAEEARRLEDEESRRRRIEELREKRRLEKQQKIQREKDHQRFLENSKRAKVFYHRLLLDKGVRSLRLALKMKRANEKRAIAFDRRRKLRVYFTTWHCQVKAIWNEKRERAEEFYELHLLRASFAHWRQLHLYYASRFLVARDWYDMRITEKVIKKWYEIWAQAQKAEAQRLHIAQAHHEWQLKWKCLEHWRRLPAISKLEKETEARRQCWRLKISELVPDYMPTTKYN